MLRDVNFNCNISNQGEVNRFVDFHIKEKNKTIKLKCNERINNEVFEM